VSLLQAIVLGVVQGLAEFLPVSSSGHLVLVPAVFGWEDHGIAFDILLHAATLIAVLVYFRSDLGRLLTALFSKDPTRSQDRRLAMLIAVGTVPTILVALLFDDVFERLFLAPGPVGVFLCVTAVVLILAERLSRVRLDAEGELRPFQAVLIGLAQGAAVAPGISRSGATIAAGLASGLDREHAARFSFLLSVPIILAATAKTLLDAVTGTATLPALLPSVVGFATAAVTGYLAIAGLLAYLRNRSLYVFAAYTGTVGIAVLVWQYVL
jgi:undecaprenyl-diphosphatase